MATDNAAIRADLERLRLSSRDPPPPPPGERFRDADERGEPASISRVAPRKEGPSVPPIVSQARELTNHETARQLVETEIRAFSQRSPALWASLVESARRWLQGNNDAQANALREQIVKELGVPPVWTDFMKRGDLLVDK